MREEVFKLMWSEGMQAAASEEGWFLDYWTVAGAVENAYIIPFELGFGEFWKHMANGVVSGMSAEQLRLMVETKAAAGSGLHALAIKIIEGTRTDKNVERLAR